MRAFRRLLVALWMLGSACMSTADESAVEPGDGDGEPRDAAIQGDASGPPPPRTFDAATRDAAAPSHPIEVRCTASGLEEGEGLELIASDGRLEAFTVRASDDAVFATAGGSLYRVEGGELERLGEAIDAIDRLHVSGDELFVTAAREGEPLVIAALDVATGARTDLASDVALGRARALVADRDEVYWAADKATDPAGGQIVRAPRAGGESERIAELPTMFLPEGAVFADDSLRVSGDVLAYIARAGDYTIVLRAPSNRMVQASTLSVLSAMGGLPPGFPSIVGVELDGEAAYVAFARGSAWSGQQGISRVPHDAVQGAILFETGEQRLLGLTSDAGALYWMMENRKGATSLFRGNKDGSAPRELASGFRWSRGLQVSDRYVYFMLADCPEGGTSLVRIRKP